jgi:hypothetical protein
MIRVSDPLEERIKDLQRIRKGLLQREVTVSEIVEILFKNYDTVREAEDSQ